MATWCTKNSGPDATETTTISKPKFALIGRPPPLRPPISIFRRQPVPQQLYVAAIRAPHHVEGVTDEWDRADKPIERDIGEHADDDMRRCAELACLVHDVERDQGSDRIADPWNQANQCIETEAHIGAGQNECRV